MDSGFLTESVLPPTVLRSLGDRSYEKRKSAALEIEAIIHTLLTKQDTNRICSIIALLGQDFGTSTNSNHRKGSLIGLAAVAIALVNNLNEYLDAILPPVLHCFSDMDSRIRYYSCESLYNIAKIARSHILKHFNQIFDGLCKLFGDVDADVRNGANLLDRLIKDIVIESVTFDVENFIPLLQKYIRRTNPFIRQLLIGWITTLDEIPNINMLDWLPEFLDGLFNMLGDSNHDIRQAANGVLAQFLRKMKTALGVQFGAMVPILVAQCGSLEKTNRETALVWIHEFITLAGDELLFRCSQMLSAALGCISDDSQEIQQLADRTNQGLLRLVQETNQNFELNPILESLMQHLKNHHVPTTIAILRWIYMLLVKVPQELKNYIQRLLPMLLQVLSDESDEVVLINLQVIARISLIDDDFDQVLRSIIDLFSKDRKLLETRGSLIIRKLCILLDPKVIYIRIALILQGYGDLDFISIMIQTLNLILLTAVELVVLRKTLINTFENGRMTGDKQVFLDIFHCWCHNPISTFSLCLLAQAYHLTAALVQQFADIDMTVGFLMQIDKLIQLLESPIYVHLRLQLLEVDHVLHTDLVKSLYGILMLIPQSGAYRTLSVRLATIATFRQHLGVVEGYHPVKRVDSTECQDLLAHFNSVQQKHAIEKQKRIEQSLVNEMFGQMTLN